VNALLKGVDKDASTNILSSVPGRAGRKKVEASIKAGKPATNPHDMDTYPGTTCTIAPGKNYKLCSCKATEEAEEEKKESTAMVTDTWMNKQELGSTGSTSKGRSLLTQTTVSGTTTVLGTRRRRRYSVTPITRRRRYSVTPITKGPYTLAQYKPGKCKKIVSSKLEPYNGPVKPTQLFQGFYEEPTLDQNPEFVTLAWPNAPGTKGAEPDCKDYDDDKCCSVSMASAPKRASKRTTKNAKEYDRMVYLNKRCKATTGCIDHFQLYATAGDKCNEQCIRKCSELGFAYAARRVYPW